MNNDLNFYGVVLVTASSPEEAAKIGSCLVELKLAACVNICPIQSIYSWQDKIHTNQEWQLIIKTKLTYFAELEAKIKELHSYEVPEIIAMPIIAGSETYLSWISDNIKQ
ncbi:MAG: divalent-cation tolerance protein CutA [Xenococcaceae cyanobacterium]